MVVVSQLTYPTLHLEGAGAWSRIAEAVRFIPQAWQTISEKRLIPTVSYHIFDKEQRALGVSSRDLIYPGSKRDLDRLADLVVALEDRRFFQHAGVDFRAVLRSAVQNARALAIVQGGSTITQQLVRNTLLTPHRSLVRKVLEMLLAWKLEKHYSKKEILDLYCQLVYLGGGIRGFPAAARTIFRKPIARLDMEEICGLLGLLRSPSRSSPFTSRSAFNSRREFIAKTLSRHTNREIVCQHRILNPVNIGQLKKPRWAKIIDMELSRELGTIPHDISRISITLSPIIQRNLDQVLQATSRREDVKQVAAVVLDNKTSEVLGEAAWENGKEAQFSPAFFGTIQPGSTFKTFALLAALEQGIGLDQELDSSPFVSSFIKDADANAWVVRNYGDRYAGLINLERAFQESDNAAFARLLELLDFEKLCAVIQRFRLSEGNVPTPAIILGGLQKGISLVALAAAYGAIARNGIYVEPKFVRQLEFSDGTFLEIRKKPEVILITDFRVAKSIQRVLLTLGKNLLGNLAFSGKTGTTRTGSLFAGYTQETSTALWVDFKKPAPENDPKALRAVGIVEKIAATLLGHRNKLLSI